MALQRAKSVEAQLQTIESIRNGNNNDNDNHQEHNHYNEPPKTILQKTKIFFANITVEPVFILYLLPSTMASLTTQNLNLEKACRVNLHMNQTICDALSIRNTTLYSEEDESRVQKLVASMYAWKNIVQSLVPAILLMFWGSWSDRHKRRKPCIIIPIFGEALSSIGFLICTYYFYELALEYCILAESIPPAITGGWFTMFMGVFSYIGEISSVETRTVRIGAITTLINASYTVGIALSGVLYSGIGFYGVFTLSLCMYIMGVVYGYVVIKEEPNECKVDVENVNNKSFLKDFFDMKHIADTFKVAFKEGNRNRKKRICVIMILVMVIIGPLHGEYTVLYLFTRYRFNWDEIDFSIYCTYSAILYTCATVFCLSFFSKYLKMDDAMLGVISSASKVLSSFIYAFAPNPIVFYMGALIEMFNGTSFIAMRSIISKLVPPDELGKINSLFGVSEALMPLVYGPMYSMVYKWTIDVVPGAFFLFGGILTFPAVIIFFWLYTEHKRDIKEEEEEANRMVKEGLLKRDGANNFGAIQRESENRLSGSTKEYEGEG